MICAWCGKVYVGEPGKQWGTCCVCRPIIDLAYQPETAREGARAIKAQAPEKADR